MKTILVILSFCLHKLYALPQMDNGSTKEKGGVSCETDQTRCVFGVYDYGISTKDRVHIVNLHNELRQSIADNMVPNQPRGVDLMKLKYDSHLAVLAQRTADRCHFGYSEKIQDDVTVGENLFMTMAGSFEEAADWSEAIMHWWSQHDMYMFGGDILPENRHYVQMVWAKTSRIGCGYVAFPLLCGQYLYYRFYVCNYAPGAVSSAVGGGIFPYENATGLPSTPCTKLCN